MKKIIIVILTLILLPLSGCGKTKRDKEILDREISSLFSETFKCTSVDYFDKALRSKFFERGYQGLSTYGQVYFKYDLGNVLIYDHFDCVSPKVDYLKCETQVFETKVYATSEAFDYSGTFTTTFLLPTYKRFVGDLFYEQIKNGVWKYHVRSNREDFEVEYTHVSSGHFYTLYEYSFSFSEKKLTYLIEKYEKNTGNPYNIKDEYHYYYFGENERYEGDDYYVISEKVNILKNIFIKFNDTDFI